MILVCFFKVTLEQRIACQGNNIMHYIVFHTVKTLIILNRVTSYKQCLSYHESKLFLEQLVV